MKACVYTKYGTPDVLTISEVATPTPGADEVLVEVHAASVNAYDWHFLTADVFLIRLMGGGLFRPARKTLGGDIAGRIVQVGSEVTRFRPGDEVFGAARHVSGGFAEFACARERSLESKPVDLSFDEAAAVPMAALTALQGLRDHGRLQAGQDVLIHGASGGVGTWAVQIAKSMGATVTAVCSSKHLETARSLGADHVIDYTREHFGRQPRRYNLIFVANGNVSMREYERALQPGGTCVMAGGGSLSTFGIVAGMVQAWWISKTSGKRLGSMLASINQKDLAFMKQLLEAGKVRPVIDRRFPLDRAADALRYLGEGHAGGKVVITVHHDDSRAGKT